MGVGLYLVVCHLLLLTVQAHSKCQKSYPCRNFTLEFPLTKIENPECGLLMVEGCDNSTFKHLFLHLGASTLAKLILGQTSKNRFLIHDYELQTLLNPNRGCYTFSNVSQLHSPSVSFAFSPNITFFTCYNNTPNNQIEDYFRNYSRERCAASTAYYQIPATREHAPSIPGICSLIQLPVNKSHKNSTALLQLLTPTFELEWSVSEDCKECFNGGGQCLTDNENKFYCKTPDSEFSTLISIIPYKSTCFPFFNISLPKSPFTSFTIPSNVTLFICSNRTFDEHVHDHFENYFSFYQNQGCDVYYSPPATDASSDAKESSIPANCGVIQLPVDYIYSRGKAGQLFDVLTAEFDLEWALL